MTLEEAKDEMLKFVKLKTTMMPVFATVIMEQAEPVIRCKDCKHRDPEDKKCDCGHGIIWQLPRDDNWFCADGERRTDERPNQQAGGD